MHALSTRRLAWVPSIPAVIAAMTLAPASAQSDTQPPRRPRLRAGEHDRHVGGLAAARPGERERATSSLSWPARRPLPDRHPVPVHARRTRRTSRSLRRMWPQRRGSTRSTRDPATPVTTVPGSFLDWATAGACTTRPSRSTAPVRGASR